MVLMFGTQSVTFWYHTSFPQSRILVRPPNPYLPLSLTLKGREGGEGSARPSATIAYHPQRPRVSVARTSDGPTDPSRRSRRVDPALERETNKIIKDDRRRRRASRCQRSTLTVEGVSRRRALRHLAPTVRPSRPHRLRRNRRVPSSSPRAPRANALRKAINANQTRSHAPREVGGLTRPTTTTTTTSSRATAAIGVINKRVFLHTQNVILIVLENTCLLKTGRNAM